MFLYILKMEKLRPRTNTSHFPRDQLLRESFAVVTDGSGVDQPGSWPFIHALPSGYERGCCFPEVASYCQTGLQHPFFF